VLLRVKANHDDEADHSVQDETDGRSIRGPVGSEEVR